MPTTEAQIQANRKNAEKSTGPRTDVGKEASRANALKHGMTGAGIVLAEADAIEIKRRSGTFAQELNAVGDMQVAIAHRAALNSVRMERGADQQIANQIAQIRQLEADFVAPEELSDEEADRLRSEAIRRAMFDPSKEAILARRYEASCERAFYKALKELRQIQAQAKAQPQPQFAPPPLEVAPIEATPELGSFFPDDLDGSQGYPDAHLVLEYLNRFVRPDVEPSSTPLDNGNAPLNFSVGRPR